MSGSEQKTMDTLIKADIFFFITSIAVIIIGAILSVALIYIVKILRDLRYIMTRAREETDSVIEDVQDLREYIRKERSKFEFMSEIIHGFLSAMFSSTHKTKSKRSPKKGKTQK